MSNAGGNFPAGAKGVEVDLYDASGKTRIVQKPMNNLDNLDNLVSTLVLFLVLFLILSGSLSGSLSDSLWFSF